MFNSLKGKNLIRMTDQRRPLKFTPAKSGRTELPASEDGELAAISRAVRHGNPLYFLRTASGTTLDVMLDKPKAIKVCEAVRDRIGSGVGVDLFERKASNFTAIA